MLRKGGDLDLKLLENLLGMNPSKNLGRKDRRIKRAKEERKRKATNDCGG